MEKQFTSVIEASNNKLWGVHFRVPPEVAEEFLAEGAKRVVCTLNDRIEKQCAILSGAGGVKVISVNKSLQAKLQVKVGDSVSVRLREDTSEYGLPLTEELAELFVLDKEGSEYFHALTAGKQRTLLYIAANVKNPQARALRAVTIIEHLKKNKGSIDYKQLHAEVATASKLR